MTWSQHEEWTTWSVENVIFDCNGLPDIRKWYSVVGAESVSEILSSLGGRPARSRRSTALLPPGARYSPKEQKRCLHESLHAAIPFDHKIETYYETGIFRIVCRAADAAFGWPLCPKSGPLKGKWDKSSLNCFYSAEAVYALMIGAVQIFQRTDGGGEIISAVGKCVAEVKCETKPYRDGGLDAASGSCSPWRRPASHGWLRARLCQPSTRRYRPGTSRCPLQLK